MKKRVKFKMKDCFDAASRYVTDTFCGKEIQIKTVLDLDDIIQYEEAMELSVFNDSGEYRPELIDFADDVAMITFYTNIEIPENHKDAYDFCKLQGIIDFICERINMDQYKQIHTASIEKIRYIANTHAIDATKKIEKNAEDMAALIASIEETFSGVSGEDISNITSAIVDGGIDEEKLMTAYLAHKDDANE